jgi:FixJ family two-component response regulator
MSPNQGTVYIVDDDESVRRAAARLLSTEGFKALTFETAHEFLEFPWAATPSCLVLDVQMPGLTGIELQERLAGYQAALPIIFISGHGDIPTSVKAIKAGAVDFLSKPVNAESLLSAIRQSIQRHAETLQRAAALAEARSSFHSLTDRERQVMELVITGISNKRIAGKLNITEATVKVHRGRVMQKMKVDSVVELVRLHDRLLVG